MAIQRNKAGKITMVLINKFEEDVLNGLQSNPKSIPSKYFYNEMGDALFVQIMSLPEYYLTRAELEIFSDNTNAIVEALRVEKNIPFNFVELGAGDGTKTILLLRELLAQGFDFMYMPIDISENALSLLKEKVEKELVNLNVQPIAGDYFSSLEKIKFTNKPTVVLFLGSSLGNMLDEEATLFLSQLSVRLKKGDVFLLGTDNIKNADVVLPAYNDAAGVTAAFNYNLLDRMNEELGTDFIKDQFKHSPEYTIEEGVAKSFLESLEQQTVYFPNSDTYIQFKQGEKFQTESSRKYDATIFKKLFEDTELALKEQFCDRQNYFTDSIFVKQ